MKVLENIGGQFAGKAGLVIGAGVVAFVVVWLVARQAKAAGGALVDAAGDAAAAVGRSVNPASDQNLIYRGVNAVGGAVTGDGDFSLGSWLYDVMNPEPLITSNPSPSRAVRVREYSERIAGG